MAVSNAPLSAEEPQGRSGLSERSEMGLNTDMTQETKPSAAERLADALVIDVCELPDRTSPEDWPEMLLITPDELYTMALAVIKDGAATERKHILAMLRAKAQQIADAHDAAYWEDPPLKNMQSAASELFALADQIERGEGL
ncbi:MAG TPA: hypothetical protein VHY35_17865 [Stellaceae bacterium]|jgi:hypothetical protein|nr:hypothetical protein [Stellaceae bacterium]